MIRSKLGRDDFQIEEYMLDRFASNTQRRRCSDRQSADNESINLDNPSAWHFDLRTDPRPAFIIAASGL